MADHDWELRSQLQRYLLGGEHLRSFQTWFVSFIWREDRSASKLARAVELALAEYTSGHRSEPELRGLLATMLERRGTQSTDRSKVQPWRPPLSAAFSVVEVSPSRSA